MKPRLLDLFCGAGGAAMGYHRAGFDVVGVDIAPQPRYPFDFVQADALHVLREGGLDIEAAEAGDVSQSVNDGVCDVVGFTDVTVGCFDIQVDKNLAGHGASLVGDVHSPKPASVVKGFNAIHASPPCQAYSALSWHPQNRMASNPDLIDPVRGLLTELGLPYVIENVEHAPLIAPTRLCGSSFGLPIRRHRLFETNWPLIAPPCAHGQQRKQFSIYRHGATILSRVVPIYGTGGGKAAEHWAAALEINWMTRPEMAEAIPPAYTELIGAQLLDHLRARSAA